MVNTKSRKTCFVPTRLALSVAAALAAIGSAPAWAISIDTGNPDIAMRLDNQVRYNAGWRMEEINPAFANAFGTDETETRFKKHDMVINRLDLFSEMDVIYKGNYGFRVSAAGWSENAYKKTSHTGDLIDATFTGPLAVPSNYGPSKTYSAYAKRYVTGTSGEFVDAFVFGSFDLGSTSLNLKLGQHDIYWGESLFTIADGVSAGQGPINTIKAATSPGAEAKELFMPINQLSAQWTLSNEVALNAQYYLDWKPFRLVPGGTYFASSDGSGNPLGGSPNCASTAPGGTCIVALGAVTPDRKSGNYGVNLRWTPAWLDGTMGFYYRKYDEKLPWSTIQVQNNSATPANLGLRLVYARDTEMLGWSLQKSVGRISAGFEVSMRRNTALNSIGGFLTGSNGDTPVGGAQAGAYFRSAASNIPLSQTPGYSQVEGARGNTFHALVNGTYLLTPTALWTSGSAAAELAYQRLEKVTKNQNIYYSMDYACKFGNALSSMGAGVRNMTDGCSTKDALGLNLSFTPEWLQAFPGWDLKMPTSLAYGLHGNAPTLGGVTEGTYKWSVGLTGTYHLFYEFAIAYNDAHVDIKTVPGTAGAGVPGVPIVCSTCAPAGGSVQNNHGWLSLRFKTSF